MNPLLRGYTKFTCGATFLLIFAGAMVKSTESGLAVPDWPLSYGMLYPPMVGGIFYEHGHRMIATFVGLLTLLLAIWLKIKESRRWVRTLGYWALGAVVCQGLLGGITVLFYLPTAISVSHGILAQIFFVLTIIIAYSQSKERAGRISEQSVLNKPFFQIMVVWIAVVFIQLILGAVMRHTQSGLAIPDFPQMGGMWIPLFNDEMLKTINNWRFENNFDPVVMPQVIYHFLHRLGAAMIAIVFCVLNYAGLKYYSSKGLVKRALLYLDVLVIIQIALGIMTVATIKSPVITSMHVVTGAAILGMSVLLFLRIMPVSLKEMKESY